MTVSADPAPLSDEEIAEAQRVADSAWHVDPETRLVALRLLATIRQRTQERDEAVRRLRRQLAYGASGHPHGTWFDLPHEINEANCPRCAEDREAGAFLRSLESRDAL